MNQNNLPDRSLRSVFVGNIPYDASEEKLRDIFSTVGPVISFRIVFDRETGKPKGYGFCEYKDQETATSAIRNLNGHDLNGRQLRVDSASNEKVRDEPDQIHQQQQHQPQQQQQQQQQQQMQIPQAVMPSEPLIDAETQINNTISTTQPEMLFEVCKQMKSSLMINPNETRLMLMQNPQLCYALLQALVCIRAIDQPSNFIHKSIVQPQPMPMYAPMPTMQPVVNIAPVVAASVVAQLPVVTQAPVAPITSALPNDPRLARQQQQQQAQANQQRYYW